MRISVVTLVATAVLLAAGRGADGQGNQRATQPASVPTELALALAAGGGLGSTGEPELLVGTLPPQFTSRVTAPRGARIVGSAATGNSVLAVFAIPTSSDSAIAHVERDLRAQGWATPDFGMSSGGGFRPAPGERTAMTAMRPMLCKEGNLLSLWPVRQETMSTTIVARLNTITAGGPSTGPCAIRMQVTSAIGGSAPIRRPPFPTLFNPPGSGDPYANSRCRPDGGSMGTQTELRSAMTAEQILDHYGRQLQDSGWTAPKEGSAIVGRVWTRKDSLGVPRHLTLTVITSPLDPRCRLVKLDVDRRPDY